MPHRKHSALKLAGMALAGLVAALGLAATAVHVLVGTEAGTAFLLPRVLGAVNGAIQGRVEVESFRVGSRGGVTLEGVRVRDPAGEVVIAADRGFARLGFLLLRLRVAAAEIELDRPSVLLRRTPEGDFTIARAFRSRRPSPEEEQPGESSWTLRLDRLAIRGGSVELIDADGTRRLAAEALDLDGRAATSRAGSDAELRLTGKLLAPLDAPLSADAAASLREGVARLPRLRAAVGETSVDAIAEWDIAAVAGRAAVRSVTLDAADLRRVLPASPLAGDVAGSLFAAAGDGVATAAFDLAQRGTPGRARGAAAVRMSSPLALGFDVDLEQLDPALVASQAPQGALTLHARGGLAGTDPDTLSAAVALDAAPSRLRGTALGPLSLRGNARGGAYQVESLDATVPGARLRGSGRYARSGPISAEARLEASDLAAAARAVERAAAISLPAVTGRARASATVSGTARAPQARFQLASPRMAVAGARASGLSLKGELGGTLERPKARAAGSAEVLGLGAEVLRKVDLAASIDDRAAEARVTAVTLRVGPDPLTVGAKGTFSRSWKTLDLAALTVAWPGTEYALAAPARVDLTAPRVDRLELASGPTRITLEGGLGRAPGLRRRSPPRTVADVRAVVLGLDLEKLPRELLPKELGIAGIVQVEAEVKGPLSAPEVVASAEASEGAAAGLSGLSVTADAEWDGATRRARVTGIVRRQEGGEVELRADFPAALAKAGREVPVGVWLRARGVPLEEVSRLARLPEPVEGAADLEVAVDGTIGAPSLTVRAAFAEVLYAGYGPYRLDVAADAPGQSVKLDAAAASDGERVLELTGSVPLDLARMLQDPARGARDLLDAPLTGQLDAPEFDLARFAGQFGLPLDLAGRMRGGADLRGTIRAPRGSLGVEANEVAAYGYRDAALQVALLLSDDSTGVAGSIAVGGEEIMQGTGYLQLPVERLAAARRYESAPLHVDLVVPDADLSQTGGRVPLAGRIDARARATGSLQQPTVDASVDGKDVRISGKPLGDLVAKAHAAGTAISADARLEVATGGVLTASLQSTAEVSLAALRRGDVAHAPSELRIVADRVDLGVLPALLPGTVRSAGGELGADLAAKGPLAALRPVGTLRVSGGRAAVAEMGEWTGVEVDASLTADAFKVDRLQAMRGNGTLDGKAEARGLAGITGENPTPAEFSAEVRTRGLTIPRAGQDLATVDLDARANGTFDTSRLRAEVTIPKGTVELPERLPREVQSLEKRPDIVIVSPLTGKPKNGGAAEDEEEETGDPYRATVRVLVPNRLFITSSNPRMNIELQADTTFDVIGSDAFAEGQVEVIRGYVEPVGGRTFTVERGRVTFTGAAPAEAVLDVVARYENPAADVTVSVSGTTKEPVVKMTSEPPMDEGQIAMLIATGRTELKAGSGGVGTLTGEEAGRAALGAVATQLFRNVVADRLPVDSVALSSSEIRAGKYVTDKIYVGYTRDFEAQPEQGENTNEILVEYQITPRWTLESRYGDARTGGASIIWSKDY